MKFRTESDKQLFKIEMRLPMDLDVGEGFPSSEHLDEFIKSRRSLVPKLKDFRKSQNTKSQWRKDRYKLMSGIKKFHKSTKGKKMHRQIGRFISTRESFNDLGDLYEVADFLKALSALKTHALIELDYYIPVDEYVNYSIFVEELIPTMNRVEKSILSFDAKLDEDDWEFLLRVVESEDVIKSLADHSGKTEAEVKEIWHELKAALLKDGKTEDDPRFYGLLVSMVKDTIGIEKDIDGK